MEKGIATHFSILAWRIPRAVYPWGRKESHMTEQLSLSLESDKRSKGRRLGKENKKKKISKNWKGRNKIVCVYR